MVGRWSWRHLFTAGILVLCVLLCGGSRAEAAQGAVAQAESAQGETAQGETAREEFVREGADHGETDSYETALLDEFDLAPLEEFLQDSGIGEATGLGFRELLDRLMAGDFTGVLQGILENLKAQLFQEVSVNSRFLGQVLILGLLGAVFANYSSIFSGSQIAETGFYVTYLLIFTFLASSFLTGISVARELLERVLEFMQALVPAFFLAVSFAGGNVTSAVGCSLMLFSMNLAQWLFLQLFLPLIRIYTLLVMAGHLVKEDLFSKATELLEQGIRWGLKTVTGLILGFHLLQGMVAPYADAVKNTPIRRLISVLPGVGQGAAAVSQMVLGAGVLIKNSIGAGAVAVLFLLSAIPLLKLVVLCLFYQGAAALLQPVCDKRLISCISAVGTGCRLLLSAAASAILLFVLSVAIVCMTSNVFYFSG